MISVKKLIAHYYKMKNEVEKNDNLKTGITCFVCDRCQEAIKTELVDKGHVPSLLICNNCKGPMKNTNFEDIAPDYDPTWEWYMPTLKEFLKFRKLNKRQNLNWVGGGGLLMRSVKS